MTPRKKNNERVQYHPMFNRKMTGISLHLKGFNFTANFLPTLITLLVLSLLLSLGFWQLHRAEIKRQILQEYETRLQAAPGNWEEIKKANLRHYQYYPVKLVGEYDNQHNIFLDNKFYQHQIGYQVLTPFFPQGETKPILINRGWLSQGESRLELPPIPPIEGIQTLEGFIYLPRSKAFMLRDESAKSVWPLLVQSINIPHLSQRLSEKLYPAIILLSPQAPNGFVRDWHPVSSPAYKNVGYAVQWFALAFVLFIIFIAVNTKREQ